MMDWGGEHVAPKNHQQDAQHNLYKITQTRTLLANRLITSSLSQENHSNYRLLLFQLRVRAFENLPSCLSMHHLSQPSSLGACPSLLRLSFVNGSCVGLADDSLVAGGSRPSVCADCVGGAISLAGW